MKRRFGALVASVMLAFAVPVHAVPFITYAVNAIDFTAPSEFVFSFATPVPPLTDGVPVNVLATLDVTVTAGPIGAPASIALAPFVANLMLNSIGTCNAGVDIGTGFSTPPNPNTQHFQTTSTFTPSVGCDSSMTSTLSFLGSGGGATYSIIGLFEINPAAVPEPGTLALLGLGLAGLGFRRRQVA